MNSFFIDFSYCVFWLKAILGAIVWVALYGTLTQFKDLYRYFKISPWDGVRKSWRIHECFHWYLLMYN